MMRKIFSIFLSIILFNQTLFLGLQAQEQPTDNSDSEQFEIDYLKLSALKEGEMGPPEPGKEQQASFFETCSNDPSVSILGCYIVKLVNLLIILIGIVSFGIIVVGGITLVTSAGNDTRVTKGKETITFAVIGLVITLSAYIISIFIQSIFYGN